MFKKILAVVFVAILLAGTACAADIAIVNGKGIPEKALTDAVKAAVAKGGAGYTAVARQDKEEAYHR